MAMKDIDVRVARSLLPEPDIEKIHSLLAHLTDRSIDMHELCTRIDLLVRNRQSRLYLARNAGEIVGMATLTIKVIPVEIAGYIDDVVRDPGIEGIGSALMEPIVEYADSRNMPLNLTTGSDRERALGLYKKFGFVVRDTNAMRRLPVPKGVKA